MATIVDTTARYRLFLMAPPAPAARAARKLESDNAGAWSAWVALGLRAASTSQMIGSKKIMPSTPRAVLMANLLIRGRPSVLASTRFGGSACPGRGFYQLDWHLLGSHGAITSIRASFRRRGIEGTLHCQPVARWDRSSGRSWRT